MIGAAFVCAVAVLLLVPCLPLLADGYLARGVRVIDGDTLQIETIVLPWDVALLNQRVRIADFDAWESSRRRRSVNVTDEEVVKGKRATQELTKLIEKFDVYVIPLKRNGRDSYGRLLGTIRLRRGDETMNLKEWMIERGHIRDVE